MNTTYQKYIPEKAIPFVQFLIEIHHFTLKIVTQRKTKHGDFRKLPNGQFQITVNNNLNKYQFLLTLVHEIAHHVTHQKFGRVQPHGKEWKTVFQHLMLPFLNPEIFSKEMLPFLANYLKNPKASSDSDVLLSRSLMEFDPPNEKTFIFEVVEGAKFKTCNGKLFRKGKKRRTRYEATELKSGRLYSFSPNAEIELINE